MRRRWAWRGGRPWRGPTGSKAGGGLFWRVLGGGGGGVFFFGRGGGGGTGVAGALTVTGPNGFKASARFVSADTVAGRATFQFTAPGGTWNLADAGHYFIGAAPNVLKDAANQPLATAATGAGAVTLGDLYYDPDVFFRARRYESLYADVAAAVNGGAFTSS